MAAIGLVALGAGPAAAGAPQDRLTLAEAMASVRAANPALRAARAAADEAAEQVPQARAGHRPRLDLSESWQRGNQPVFVFGSLLAQQRFAQENFDLARLNRPDPIGNFRTALTAEQLVFDGGQARAAVRGAELGRDIARSAVAQAESDLELATARAYGAVLEAAARQRAAEAAVAAATDDVRTATDRRDIGVGTEADLLALEVHLAQMRARTLAAGADESVARGMLNRLMGVPLDRVYVLDEPRGVPGAGGARGEPVETIETPEAIERMEARALETRPESRRAAFEVDLARARVRGATAALLPQVAVQGAYEWNGGTFASRAPAWSIGTQARVNLSGLFGGSGDLARRRAAASAVVRAEAARADVEAGIRLDVRAAVARLQSSEARQAVGVAVAAQARESQRMIRDRYEAGLADVGAVLRAAQAMLDAEALRMTTAIDAQLDRAALAHAVGAGTANP
jgi:outer membrane protein TolC